MFGISELFGKSPFQPLYEHMVKVKDCVDKLPELADAYFSNDHDRTCRVFEQICKLEHVADVAKQNIRNSLPKTYFLPVDRGDILEFLNAQDSIADAIEDVAVLMTIRKTTVPEKLVGPFKKMVEEVVNTGVLAFNVSGEIKDLVETGFGGYEASMVGDRIEKVGEAEWKADKAQMEVSRKLFELESEIDPVSILMIDKVIVRLGKVANNAELTADMMRNMLTKK